MHSFEMPKQSYLKYDRGIHNVLKQGPMLKKGGGKRRDKRSLMTCTFGVDIRSSYNVKK